jgi:hypothetical protein
VGPIISLSICEYFSLSLLPFVQRTLLTRISSHSLEIFALFMLTGIFSTLLLPETKQKSLEELSQESQEGFVKGVAAKIETRDGLVVAQTH